MADARLIRLGIHTMARLCTRGSQEPEAVVVLEGADRDARQVGKFGDALTHGVSVDPDPTSGSRVTPRSRQPNRELIRNETHGEVHVLQAIVLDGHDAEA